MKELLACLILCMMFANCNNPEKALSQKQTIFNENQLIVTLYTHDSIVASESKIQITTRFYNSGEQEIKLEQSSILENPILSLIITNEKGNTIPTIPPSVPQDENSLHSAKILKTKEEYTINYNLNIFSPILPKGKYCVAMKNGLSNKVWFTIE